MINMEKYEIVMLINRLIKLKHKEDMIKALKAVADTEMSGAILGSDKEIKGVWKKLFGNN